MKSLVFLGFCFIGLGEKWRFLDLWVKGFRGRRREQGFYRVFRVYRRRVYGLWRWGFRMICFWIEHLSNYNNAAG